jgi:CDGSH-type Zn-finger protein/uncharacterized Fe-S cluster protein YjdI
VSRQLREYKGLTLTVSFDGERCIHAGECVKGLPKVFDAARSPWVDPDGASATAVMGVVERCPSGALQYRFGNGARSERPPRGASVTLVPGGPLQIRGELRLLTSEDGEPIATGTRLALCRCGRSARKPFCDGAHAKSGFNDPGTLGEVPPPKAPPGPLPAAPALEIRVRPEGPLKVAGEFQFLDGAGRVLGAGREAALCRCGASGNRPFCDGSHRTVGFEAK